jgi:uncharacterized protein YggT (Ycf19 family)
MTHDHRTDPDPRDPRDPQDAHAREHAADDTRPVERQQYVEREQYVERDRAPEHYDPPPAERAPAGSQVNVNAERGGGYVAATPGPLYYARRVVSLIFGILAVLLVLRVLFLLLVANETNAIVDFIYAVTEPFVAPFRGIFNFDTVSPGGASVLDVAAVVALVGWFLIYLLIMAILSIGDRRTA